MLGITSTCWLAGLGIVGGVCVLIALLVVVIAWMVTGIERAQWYRPAVVAVGFLGFLTWLTASQLCSKAQRPTVPYTTNCVEVCHGGE